eukprot:CAMPEP_0204589288 /NCGR_PEP_ID=MMETSP0661-20131031/49113_1 /ASSEMBLY_ACC=CAM_ASM_000606 /TAXON_ID=109239 /ORGANISM="Alexandrium margalefi, Strain AMGDE01CS-322" /LENGTH=237 /DNA_ID=CAMNT_0051599197 /DNA_START=63 /DNA_END=776 /DNA_ORIENTATION=+
MEDDASSYAPSAVEDLGLAEPALSPRARGTRQDGLEDLASRGDIRTPRYQRPAHSSTSRRADEQSVRGGPRDTGRFKTERWREKGPLRWPCQAGELVLRQPCQFHRAEEVVPLQKVVANSQSNLPGEMWCRSLRQGDLNMHDIGRHNQNVATTAVSEMFDRSGYGWSGKTNAKRQGRPTPSMDEWVDRPVAQGKMGLDHMGGSRYSMSNTPRVCVPNSMRHSSAPGGVRGTAPMSAR